VLNWSGASDLDLRTVDLTIAHAKAVVRSIIEQNSPLELGKAAAQIDGLLTMGLSEDELAHLFYPELGIYYVPPADGLSYADWLRSIRDLLVSVTPPKP
jgi:hypothetical protein